jgi:hypothetical protein
MVVGAIIGNGSLGATQPRVHVREYSQECQTWR